MRLSRIYGGNNMKYFLINLVFLVFCCHCLLAQTDTAKVNQKARFSNKEMELAVFKRPTLLAVTATISPGIMLRPVISNIYFQGTIEYYTEDRISLRTDGYYYINTIEDYKPFKKNHSLFIGGSYHLFEKSQFDPFIGFQPGIAMSQKAASDVCLPDERIDMCAESNITYNPLISGIIGFNYYAKKTFHLFAGVRYINGRHLSNSPVLLNLDEIRFSFGLGLNIRTKKDKKKTIKLPEDSKG